jgi:hypothetical protein
MKKIGKRSLAILRASFNGFVDDKVLKLSASLAKPTP